AVTAPSDQSTSEGTAATTSLGSFKDPGGNLDASYAIMVAWGDGSSPSIGSASTPGSLGSATHTFDDNGTYHVTVTVTDKDSASGSARFDVTVSNVAPTATFDAPASAPAGFPFTLS